MTRRVLPPTSPDPTLTQQVETHHIFWRDDLVFEIHDVREFKLNCFIGKYEPVKVHPRVRRLFDHFNDVLPEGDNYAGPGFVVANWSVQVPGRPRAKISVPFPNYDDHTIVWQLVDDDGVL